MKRALVLLGGLLAAGCQPAIRSDVARTPQTDEAARVLDVDALEPRDLAARFPGTDAVRLVKVVRVPERKPGGGCVADFPAEPGTTRLELSYETEEGSRQIRGTGFDALEEDGWLPAWRTPAGVGFEKAARFRRIDLSLEQLLVCRCFDGERPVARVPSRLRIAWREGERIAVSAVAGEEGRALPPAISAGRLLRYEFRVVASIPGRPRAACAARLEVMLLVEPPFV